MCVHGHIWHIAALGLSFTTEDTELGISANIPKQDPNSAVNGYFYAPASSQVTIGLAKHSETVVFYLDEMKIKNTRIGNCISIKLDAGLHRWELTASLPVPLSPSVLRTEYTLAGAIVHGILVGGASSYEAEISDDQARTWRHVGETTIPRFTLADLTCGKKYHIRLIAKNEKYLSAPGPEYLLYITMESPSPPDGLSVTLSAGAASLAWGEILGVTEYLLYRRKRGEAKFSVAYAGLSTCWIDTDPSILPSSISPRNPISSGNAVSVACEYYVTAKNHIGESRSSRGANTDPRSWRNWNPTSSEPFRRTQEPDEGPLPNDGGARYYPN